MTIRAGVKKEARWDPGAPVATTLASKADVPDDVEVMRRLRSELFRNQHLLGPFLDSLSWAVAITTATYLRYQLNAHRSFTGSLFVVIVVAVAAQLIIGYFFLYRVQWKIGSFEQIAALSSTIAGTSCVLLLAFFLSFRHYVPLGAVVAAGPFTLVLTAGGRCGWRLFREYQHVASEEAERTIVFGAGDGGRQVIDALLTSSSALMYPVSLLDDDPGKRHLQVRHLRVMGGRESMREIAKKTRATTLIIAIPSADSDLVRAISELALASDLAVRVLPPVSQLFALKVDVADIRPITEADLLGRRTVDTNVESISEYLTGRRILVTGAGGSIGSELCRQVYQFAPSTLVMLDRDESGLQQVQLSIEGSAMLNSRSLVVCDIRDADALKAVFAEHEPEVVFHAAALKHLPLLEMWPGEAVKTNVVGTLNVLRCSVDVGVSKFVNISTDKAAEPISVLGYTKRLAERVTATVGHVADGDFLSVRFGNVLGSRGSFLTTFRAQIEAGGPVTVTDPEVSRYFMTIQEAVQLTIQAGALGTDGRVFLLDMGLPVRIADVAQRLIKASGQPIRIVYTGLRPGEKMHEHLISSEDVLGARVHPLIESAEVPAVDLDVVDGLDLLSSPDEIGRSLQRLCAAQPTLSPNV